MHEEWAVWLYINFSNTVPRSPASGKVGSLLRLTSYRHSLLRVRHYAPCNPKKSHIGCTTEQLRSAYRRRDRPRFLVELYFSRTAPQVIICPRQLKRSQILRVFGKEIYKQTLNYLELPAEPTCLFLKPFLTADNTVCMLNLPWKKTNVREEKK